MNNIFIIGVAFVALSCSNGKGGNFNEPYDGGHGIGIDTATVHEIERCEDSLRTKEPVTSGVRIICDISLLRHWPAGCSGMGGQICAS